ncbi:MAG: hypothetical protein J6Z49_05055 [Kiritimatiellae bacterium]|nr:hypothetical protein [Kiritimatiellia bacterium]
MNPKRQEKIFAEKNAFHQEVRMPAVQTEGLSDDELAVALAYEVEPFSRIPASEAEVAWRPVSGDDSAFRVFEVAVVRRAGNGKGTERAARLLFPLACAGVLAVLLGVADFANLSRRLGKLEKTVAVRKPLQAQLDRLRKQADADRRAAQVERDRREAAIKAQEKFARIRAAYPALLKALSDSFSGRAVVQSIDKGGAFAVTIRATASDARTATDVMVACTRALAEQGWKLRPGAVETGYASTAVFSCEARFSP